MGRVVIVAYRPREGKDGETRQAVRDHARILHREGLVTERPAVVLRAADGTYLEVFEWASPEAIQAAHRNPAVQELWARFQSACEYVPLKELAEAGQLFAEFEAIDP